MNIADFDFDLPPELIAQEPSANRDDSRLLVVDRASGELRDLSFAALPAVLRRGDLLVFNNTAVFAARLIGVREPGGGAAECLLLRQLDDVSSRPNEQTWEALVHPGQRLRPGSRLRFGAGEHAVSAEVLARRFHGRRTVRLWTEGRTLEQAIDAIGHIPLPPYIKRADRRSDRDRYQTIYARRRGSIAAPTAGLHFTPDVMTALDRAGVERAEITLHVGYGTFQPVRSEPIEEHRMEPEHYEVGADAAEAINRAHAEKRRVIAVGTTTARTLESLDMSDGRVRSTADSTSLFITPGYRFRIISGLLTNFHVPRSTLLMLVSAFAGRDLVLRAYRHAVEQHYRFYSYGDVSLFV